MIKNTKFSILLILSTILLANCSSVQKAFDPQNKNTSEEFLVEKRWAYQAKWGGDWAREAKVGKV